MKLVHLYTTLCPGCVKSASKALFLIRQNHETGQRPPNPVSKNKKFVLYILEYESSQEWHIPDKCQRDYAYLKVAVKTVQK